MGARSRAGGRRSRGLGRRWQTCTAAALPNELARRAAEAPAAPQRQRLLRVKGQRGRGGDGRAARPPHRPRSPEV